MWSKKAYIGLLAAGVCVGVTPAYLRGDGIDSIWGFLALSFIGCLGTAMVGVFAYAFSLSFFGPECSEEDKVIITISVTLIVVCLGLLVVKYWPGLGDGLLD